MRAARWGDNDQYLGPFTFGVSDYRPWAVVLTSSGSGEDNDRACELRINLRALYLIVTLPNIIKPHRTKVFPKWDAATVERLGRDYYWDVDPRQYGFSCNDGHFSIYYGRTGGSSCDSTIEQRWSRFLPWTEWRHVSNRVYDADGKLVADVAIMPWDERQKVIDGLSKVRFLIEDFDGTPVSVTTHIEDRTWHRGTGLFRWLRFVWPNKYRRSLDISFDAETGPEKGSWKGGTLGTGIEMMPGEDHETAFRRYCNEEHRSKHRKYQVKFISRQS